MSRTRHKRKEQRRGKQQKSGNMGLVILAVLVAIPVIAGGFYFLSDDGWNLKCPPWSSTCVFAGGELVSHDPHAFSRQFLQKAEATVLEIKEKYPCPAPINLYALKNPGTSQFVDDNAYRHQATSSAGRIDVDPRQPDSLTEVLFVHERTHACVKEQKDTPFLYLDEQVRPYNGFGLESPKGYFNQIEEAYAYSMEVCELGASVGETFMFEGVTSLLLTEFPCEDGQKRQELWKLHVETDFQGLTAYFVDKAKEQVTPTDMTSVTEMFVGAFVEYAVELGSDPGQYQNANCEVLYPGESTLQGTEEIQAHIAINQINPPEVYIAEIPVGLAYNGENVILKRGDKWISYGWIQLVQETNAVLCFWEGGPSITSPPSWADQLPQ